MKSKHHWLNYGSLSSLIKIGKFPIYTDKTPKVVMSIFTRSKLKFKLKTTVLYALHPATKKVEVLTKIDRKR